MEIDLRGGFKTKDPKLDRIPQFDPKSRLFKASDVLPVHREPRTTVWDCSAVLDQGEEGACVGFAWTYELIAEPFPTPDLDDAAALELYALAKVCDDYEGEDYEGSSVLGGAKATRQRGYLEEYRWAYSLDEVLLALSYRGPVVLGINWYDSMYEAPGGEVTVAGSLAGGHAIMARGVDMEKQAIILRNSWGPDWGGGEHLDAGDAFLSFDDLRRLLSEQGEACIPVLRS